MQFSLNVYYHFILTIQFQDILSRCFIVDLKVTLITDVK